MAHIVELSSRSEKVLAELLVEAEIMARFLNEHRADLVARQKKTPFLFRWFTHERKSIARIDERLQSIADLKEVASELLTHESV